MGELLHMGAVRVHRKDLAVRLRACRVRVGHGQQKAGRTNRVVGTAFVSTVRVDLGYRRSSLPVHLIPD